MKKAIFVQCIAFLAVNGYSQSLEGVWKGRFETSQNISIRVPRNTPYSSTVMVLRFHWNQDSSYTVYSYTKGLNASGQDTTVICKVRGEFSKDSVFLEETDIESPKQFVRLCFQKMFLKLRSRKRIMELSGVWKCASDKALSSGPVYFWKRNEPFKNL
jgi:hypothetical protein